ncbi:hypothetical protein MJO29_014474 [Puccinia striiformis f. sp. tritici]|nr:hypothetical protein MJO29_014474 [Puccinia striiformis f. sp. tritici]
MATTSGFSAAREGPPSNLIATPPYNEGPWGSWNNGKIKAGEPNPRPTPATPGQATLGKSWEDGTTIPTAGKGTSRSSWKDGQRM